MEEIIKKFIVENFLYGKGNIKYDESLFESGIIDSLGLLKLLAFIEKTFNVSIDMSEVSMQKFDSINEIVRLIKGKKNKKSN